MNIDIELPELLEDAGLTVYPDMAPEDADYPCVVYQRISTPKIRTHAGVVLEYPRYQFSCWSPRKQETVQTADRVKEALDLNQIHFKLATQEEELDLPDQEAGLYRRVLDFFIWIDKE